MGLFNVPQFIDIEDKIVGPLTAKQLGWIAAGGVILLVCWTMLDTSALILVAIAVGFVFGMLAFYRPNGQPLIMFIFSVFNFFTKPKMYVWKRVPDMKKAARLDQSRKNAAKKEAETTVAPKKEISGQRIEDISKLLDTRKQ